MGRIERRRETGNRDHNNGEWKMEDEDWKPLKFLFSDLN